MDKYIQCIDRYSGAVLNKNDDGTYTSSATGKKFTILNDVFVPLYIPDGTSEDAHLEGNKLVGNSSGRVFDFDDKGNVLTDEQIEFNSIHNKQAKAIKDKYDAKIEEMRRQGELDAEAIRQQGELDAEAIRKQGELDAYNIEHNDEFILYDNYRNYMSEIFKNKKNDYDNIISTFTIIYVNDKAICQHKLERKNNSDSEILMQKTFLYYDEFIMRMMAPSIADYAEVSENIDEQEKKKDDDDLVVDMNYSSSNGYELVINNIDKDSANEVKKIIATYKKDVSDKSR